MSVQTQDVVKWDTKEVENFLAKNNIYGCGRALRTNNVDGVSFLALDPISVARWGISHSAQQKILGLVNNLNQKEQPKKAVILPLAPKVSYPTVPKKIDSMPPPVPPPKPFSRSLPPAPLVAPSIPVRKPVTNAQPVPSHPAPPVLPPKPPNLRRPHVIISNGAADANCGEPESPTVGEDGYEIPRSQTTTFTSDSLKSRGSNDYPTATQSQDAYEIPLCQMSTSEVNPTNESRIASSNVVEEDDCHSYDSFSSDPDESSFNSCEDETYEVLDDIPSQVEKSVNMKTEEMIRKVGLFSNFFVPTSDVSLEPSLPVSMSPAEPPVPPVRNGRKKVSPLTSSQTSLASENSSVRPRTGPKLHSQSGEPLPSYPPPRLPAPSSRGPAVISSGSPSSSSLLLSFPTPRAESNGSQRASLSPSDRSSCGSEVSIHPWYFNLERRQAEARLLPCGDGTFLIRPSKHGGQKSLFTLSLIYKQRIFHVLVRRRTDGYLALGTEKPDENAFPSLGALIEHHRKEPMQLHANNQIYGTTCLKKWPEN